MEVVSRTRPGVQGFWGTQGLAVAVAVVLVLAQAAGRVECIRFVIDKKECWQHEVPYDGDQVRASYVVIKSESAWNLDHTAVGLDLVVRPSLLAPPPCLSLSTYVRCGFFLLEIHNVVFLECQKK